MIAARAIFIGPEDASVKRLNAEHRKEAVTHERRADRLGFAVAGDVETGAMVESHLLKDIILFLPIEEVRCRDREARHSGETCLGRDMPELDEAIGIVEGQGLQQDGVNHAEDGGIGTDTEGHDEYGNQGEAGALKQPPECVSQILQN